eukprot:SAG31_NODE_1515_length_8037_cov_2.470773_3_plen_117_part_00
MLALGILSGTNWEMHATVQGHWFDEYTINSQAEDNIFLEMKLENLAMAIKSADRADRIEMKLARKPTPCLLFEIRTMSTTIAQCLPVTVLTKRQVRSYFLVFVPTIREIRDFYRDM